MINNNNSGYEQAQQSRWEIPQQVQNHPPSSISFCPWLHLLFFEMDGGDYCGRIRLACRIPLQLPPPSTSNASFFLAILRPCWCFLPPQGPRSPSPPSVSYVFLPLLHRLPQHSPPLTCRAPPPSAHSYPPAPSGRIPTLRLLPRPIPPIASEYGVLWGAPAPQMGT